MQRTTYLVSKRCNEIRMVTKLCVFNCLQVQKPHQLCHPLNKGEVSLVVCLTTFSNVLTVNGVRYYSWTK